jgi:hypothetical protein
MENLHLKNLKSNTINKMKIKQNALELKQINDNFYRNISDTLEVIKETNFENQIIKDYLESYFFKIIKQIITLILDDVTNLTNLIFKINDWTIDTQITKEELETLELNNNVYLTDDKIIIHYTKCLNYYKDEHTLTELVIEIDSNNNIIDISVTDI